MSGPMFKTLPGPMFKTLPWPQFTIRKDRVNEVLGPQVLDIP